jgi:hypothetical protein
LNNLFDHEYVVRAIGVNSTGQLGFSNLSGSTRATQAAQDLTAQVLEYQFRGWCDVV